MRLKHLTKACRLACLLTLVAGCRSPRPLESQFAHAQIASADFFPILPWDPHNGFKGPFKPVITNGLETIAECNFNMAGFVFPRDLPTCEKLGLGALVLPSDPDFTSFAMTRKWRELSDSEIDRRVKRMVDAAGKSPAVAGFFIMDEPGILDFPALGKAVAAVKKHAPGKLAYINLFPDYATIGATNKSQLGTSNYTEYLERFVSEVKPQVLSYDNYMVEMSQDLADAKKAASYYRNLLEIRRVAQKHGLPYLNIVTSNQIRPVSTPPSPANLRFHAATTLAAGCRGVTWFTYYQRNYPLAPIDSAGNKTLVWSWLREINGEIAQLAPIMSRLKSTGVYFTTPTPGEKLPELPGELISSVTCATPVMVGEFADPEGERYVMVVNLSLEKSAKFSLQTARAFSEMKAISALDRRRRSFDPKATNWLTAGEGLLIELGR